MSVVGTGPKRAGWELPSEQVRTDQRYLDLDEVADFLDSSFL